MIQNVRLQHMVVAIFYMIAFPVFAQTSGPSHLERMTYEDLLELFNDFDGDSLAQERIARTYLERARRDGDTVKVARGYDRLARVFQPETNIKYADSLIEYTKDWQHITYPAMGYILKGYEYGLLDNMPEKYKLMTLALKLAKSNNNVAQKIYLLGEISKLRLKWGSLEKAHLMLEERHQIILSSEYLLNLRESTRESRRNSIDEIYKSHLLESYESLIISYIAQNKFNLAKSYLDSLKITNGGYDGIAKDDYYWWIKDVEVELEYYLGNFSDAINKSSKLLNNEEFKSHDNKYFNTMLFRALAELESGNINESLELLNTVERNHEVFGSIHNEYLKKLFEGKLKIFRLKGDLQGQLHYLDKLLGIDSINSEMFKYIEPRMVYEMDAGQLLSQKEQLIVELNNVHKKDRFGLVIIGVLLLVVTFLAIFYYRQKVIFKKRFETLLENKGKVTSKIKVESKLDLAPSVIEDILARLDKFAKEKHYLDPEITLNSLAKTFQTNSSYLSRVLNHHKKQNFSQYLNGLRVGYALERLKNHPTFRKYTIEAIAYECGYKNSASFSRAFYRITGIYPSYYINELNKIKE